MRYRFSIDPGLTGTGLAVWGEGWGSLRLPVHVENFTGRSRKEDWWFRAEDLAQKLDRCFDTFQPVEVYCEFPELFSGAEGLAVAAKGDLQKLTFVVGLFAQMAWNHGSSFTPYFPREWKGQTSKQQVEKKIHLLLPEISSMKVESHSWDAIGIGLFAQGLYKRGLVKPQGSQSYEIQSRPKTVRFTRSRR